MCLRAVITAFAIIELVGPQLVGQAVATETSIADSVRKYRFLAKMARDKKEYATAASYYEEFLRYKPHDLAGTYRLGQMRLQAGDTAGAKAVLGGAIALDSLHVNANILLYSTYIATGVMDSAAMCLERVLQARPQDAEKRRTLADLYRRAGTPARAIPHYEALLQQVDEPEEIIELLALLNEDLGRKRQALAWRQRLLDSGAEDAPAKREALETLARLQLETGDIASVFQTLEQLARTDTANRYSYYSRISTLAEEHGQTRMMLRGWEGMVRANPRDLQTLATLVEYFINHAQVQRAKQWLQRGLRLDPADAHLQLLNGDILASQGDESAALTAFELARADPRWEAVAQQRIWIIRPPETEEERLRKAFFGQHREERERKQD